MNNLTFYTNLFWGASAVLMTDVEDQFVQACTILDTIVSTLNFSDSVVSNVFLGQDGSQHVVTPFFLTFPPAQRPFLTMLSLPACNLV